MSEEKEAPKEARTLKRLNSKEFELTIINANSTNVIKHTRVQLIKIYQELGDLIGGTNQNLVILKKNLEKIGEIENIDELKAFRIKIGQLENLDKYEKTKAKIEELQTNKIEWMKQKEEIHRAIPEIERAKKQPKNK